MGLDRPTSPAFITPTQPACSAQSDLWGVGGQRDCPQLHKSACFPADGHKRRDKKGFGAGQSQSVRLNVALTVSSSFRDSPRHSLSGWLFLSAPFGEGLLIHLPENGRFIRIDIINEEAGSMLHQLTLLGKGKWAFFGRLVPKLKTGTHSK